MLLLLHLHLILRRDASHRPCLSAALQALTSIILIAIIIIILVQYAFTLVIGMHYCCCCCCFCRPLLLCSACFLIAAFPCLSHLIRRMCYSASIGLYQPSQPGPNSQTVSPLPSPPVPLFLLPVCNQSAFTPMLAIEHAKHARRNAIPAHLLG